MKRIMLLIVFVVMFSLTINVNAENKVVEEGNSEFNNYKTQYNKGIQKTTINSSGTITLYGYSSCEPGNCSYKYSNTSQDFKEVLKQSVSCSGGEKYINYYKSGAADGFKENNSQNYDGEVYWSEDFTIVCTNTSSSNTIPLSNVPNQPTTEPSTQPSGSNEYPSSGGTTENESQGVETYYIILGIVGIITYLLTVVVKKQNLFKKV